MKQKSIKKWFHGRFRLIFPFLAFIIPLLARVVPEALMGQYLVGFDTMGYYLPNISTWLGHGVNFFGFLSAAPLFYLLLMGITAAGAPLGITLKIVGPLLLGLLSLSVFTYASKALMWSHKKSLSVALLSSLYFVALRISWDMFRSELALIFMFLALILLQKDSKDLRNLVLLSLTMTLVALTHQLIAVILFAIIIAQIGSYLIKRNRVETAKLIGVSIPPLIFFLIIVYLSYFVFSSPIIGYSANYGGGFQALTTAPHGELVINTLGFLAFCYLPLIPLLIFGRKGMRKTLHLNVWIIWAFIPLLLAIISPSAFFLGGVLPYRWIMLLTYPISFYAIEGLFAIKNNWYKIIYKIAALSLVAALSIGFMVLPNSGAISYFGAYPTYIPKSMLQNTLQLSDCQSTVNVLQWAKDNLPSNGILLAHEAFYGWAILYFDANRTIPYFFDNPEVTASRIQNESTNPLYLIWWVNGTGWYDQQNVPSSFLEIYHSENIAIYQFFQQTK